MALSAEVAIAFDSNLVTMLPDSIGRVAKVCTKELAVTIELVSLDVGMKWC